ncbi:MAG TPA: cyclic peptide export ABC transporter [Puia sp.]|jgi:cyclic peptide transporter|nr:cyclic peptide export ABC transporter [Puia sp.]
MNIWKGHLRKYLFFIALSIVSAVGNMGIVYMINRIINDYFKGTPLHLSLYLAYFVIVLAVYLTARWIVAKSIINFTQDLLSNTRTGLLRKVLRSSFNSVVSRKEKVFSALTRDTDNIVNASINLVDILTNVLVILICFVYMGILSWKILLCMLAITLFTLIIYYNTEKVARTYFEKGMVHYDSFIKYLGEVLSGFKEIVMERKKGVEIADRHFDRAVFSASDLFKRAQLGFLNTRIMGQVAFYTFITLLLLILGEAFHVSKSVTVNFVFLILYVWGPIETVILLIPNLSQARMSAKRLDALGYEIENAGVDDVVTKSFDFNSILLEDITYSYEGKDEEGNSDQFSIGPVSFRLERGDVIFISGGNGSGKTTFMNVMIGLFNAEGSIYVNDLKIDDLDLAGYRGMFAPVFSDFHLFDECYGVGEVDVDKANQILAILEIDAKVSLKDRKFSTVDLSAGQRKRLALFSALLERKPILVLDEFAANSDPKFKAKFYREIIQYLRAEGFTIVAITHDDDYYSYADKVYRMEFGKLYNSTQESILEIARINA